MARLDTIDSRLEGAEEGRSTDKVLRPRPSGIYLREVDDYYSEVDPVVWADILGPDLHYHFGDHRRHPEPLEGMRQAVRNTYAYLPRGGRILDAGCGWGGPARMLAEEHDCDVTCVTVSTAQAAFCRKLGLNVVCSDLETLELKEHYDGILMMESLSHIRGKGALLAKLRQATRRLVMTANCINDDELTTYRRRVHREHGSYLVHDGNLLLNTPGELSSLLEQTRWTVRKLENRRPATLPTIWFWETNLRRRFGSGRIPSSLSTLAKMVGHVRQSPDKFIRTYPLVDVVADAT